MFDIALGAFLFLSPIIFLFGNNARINGTIAALGFYQFKTLSLENNIIQLQFFQYGIVILFIIALMQKPIRYFQDKYLAYFLGLCGLSVFIYPKTLTAFILIFLGCLFYYLIVGYAKNIKKLLYIIAGVSILNTFFAILQFFNIYLFYNPPENMTICGMMFSPSHLGTYQALALPICYMINPYLAIIPLIGLLLAKSITPILAGIVGIIYLLFPKKKRIFINLAPMGLIASLGIFIILLIGNFKTIFCKFAMRFELWVNVLKEIIKRSLTGFGLGTFPELSSKIYSYQGHWKWIYNEYLSIAFYIGILGLFPVIIFLKNKFNGIGVGLERAIATSCLIIAIICLGQPAMHFPRLAGTIIPLFAFLEILKRKEGVPLK